MFTPDSVASIETYAPEEATEAQRKDAEAKARCIEDLPELLEPSGVGCTIKYSKEGVPVGISFSYEMDGQLHTFKGSALDRSLSASNIVNDIAARQAQEEAEREARRMPIADPARKPARIRARLVATEIQKSFVGMSAQSAFRVSKGPESRMTLCTASERSCHTASQKRMMSSFFRKARIWVRSDREAA